METRVCSKCKQEKPLSQFGARRKKNGWVGLKTWCKSCCSEAQRARYAADPSINTRAVESRRNNPDFHAYRHAYDVNRYSSQTEEEKQEERERQRIWRDDNRDHINSKSRENRRLRYSDPEYAEKQRQKEEKRYQEDISFRLKSILRSRLNSSLSNNQKSGSSVRDLGCTIPQLKTYLESKFQPGMTWENHGRESYCWHIDHIIPLSAFDLADRQHFLLACNYLNLQPMWGKENFSKNDKYPIFPWMQDAA